MKIVRAVLTNAYLCASYSVLSTTHALSQLTLMAALKEVGYIVPMLQGGTAGSG